jgi:hypothetical protein
MTGRRGRHHAPHLRRANGQVSLDGRSGAVAGLRRRRPLALLRLFGEPSRGEEPASVRSRSPVKVSLGALSAPAMDV